MKKNSKPGSQGQENDDKSTTRFEMEDKFVSIENEDQDHANTSLCTRMIMLMESRKDRISKRQTEKLIFSCGVLTCIFIKKTDMHSYTINGSRTTYLCSKDTTKETICTYWWLTTTDTFTDRPKASYVICRDPNNYIQVIIGCVFPQLDALETQSNLYDSMNH